MTATERHDLLARAISTYGRQAQTDMMLEEMSELTKALLKERRVPPLPVNGLESAVLSIREEMADVQIVLDQMKQIYGDVSDIEEAKLLRLKQRLDASNLARKCWQLSPVRGFLRSAVEADGSLAAALQACRRPMTDQTEGGDSHAEG